jgi:hypothetical protein
MNEVRKKISDRLDVLEAALKENKHLDGVCSVMND